MSHLREIERDLDWRESELALMRKFLTDSAVKKIAKHVLFRSAWTLLYAHFEGFVKFALTVYFDALMRSRIRCDQLPMDMKCFALQNCLRDARSLSSADFLNFIVEFREGHLNKVPVFPEVDTKSNLSASVLEGLLKNANINLPSLPLHDQKIDTLVRRRNKIAHGERDMITEIDYYLSYENAVLVLAYELAYEIDSKIASYSA